MNDKNIFIKNKMKEISSALISNQPFLDDLIGEISDLFSSAYKREFIADNDTIQDLWFFLFDIFIRSDSNNVKFDIISTMCDMYIYQSNVGLELSLHNIEQWRKKFQAGESSPEIIDCIDDMLSM
ncbi:hypothetical protein R0L47_19135 [Pectobacterium polonicum]|uniref:hypothetical protein n=1 Tax=Pectobacterium polonicum TaxID=2485124 RepID=UPI0010F93B8F|nr:hypothetical protein [Pectobacterium polonicum]TKY81113.1 hypothetical protein EDI29_17045 [Pectobacterium polonicum]